jgi:hypothetical protein
MGVQGGTKNTHHFHFLHGSLSYHDGICNFAVIYDASECGLNDDYCHH